MTAGDTESRLLNDLRRNPNDTEVRLVYADLLEDRGDPGAEFLRIQLELTAIDPDHAKWRVAEERLGQLRPQLRPDWLAVVAPRAQRERCSCLSLQPGQVTTFHREVQDTSCDGWKRLCDQIDEAAGSGAASLSIRLGDDWPDIVTLPRTIAKLTALRELVMYGSPMVRLPPELGQLTELRSFTPYTSYGLHWFPYELTRGQHLADSTVSTRALYGNFKTRIPFPALHPPRTTRRYWGDDVSRDCCVCGATYVDRAQFRAWTSLRVATDVLPLLVNACSQACIDALPASDANHATGPHRGGRDLQQPPTRW